uniref:NADH-ubiquinone oxidoreductase chain 4L n=1 Tax=Proteus anguinus TaxID=221568 RepID=C9DHG8_PROAG|nr:NADH dehydrogenase subunit 4L [Proteus anguinus]ACU00373.1 NADH dehydrogenase subunit 4L [Proteus anguinus]
MISTMLMLCIAFTVGLLGLIMHRTHFLSALLCLEGVMLTLFIGISAWPGLLHGANVVPLPMFLLTFSACEASTGLALMIATSRTHGTDHLKALNLLQC